MFLAYYSLGLYLTIAFTIGIPLQAAYIYHGNTVKHGYSATSIIMSELAGTLNRGIITYKQANNIYK